MTSSRGDFQEDARFRIMQMLHENPELSQRELARALGVSTGRLHFLLNSLIEKGFVKLGKFRSAEDKRRYAYILTPKGLSEKAALGLRFLQRRLEEYEQLRFEIERLQSEFDRRSEWKAEKP